MCAFSQTKHGGCPPAAVGCGPASSAAAPGAVSPPAAPGTPDTPAPAGPRRPAAVESPAAGRVAQKPMRDDLPGPPPLGRAPGGGFFQAGSTWCRTCGGTGARWVRNGVLDACPRCAREAEAAWQARDVTEDAA